MSLFVRRPEVRAISYQDVWGSGGDVSSSLSQEKALRLVAVYAATRLIADAVASLPLQTYRRRADGSRERVADGPLVTSPSSFGTRYDWIHRCVVSMALRGNATGLAVLGADGWPVAVEWLNPAEVSFDARQVFWQGRPIDETRLVHIPWYTLPGSRAGLSPIASFAVTIDGGLEAARFGRDWMRNGAVPSGHLRNNEKTVTPQQSAAIRERLAEAVRGRHPLVTGVDWSYDAISVNAEESQFLDTIKATATQVAAIYGVPAEMIGGEPGGSMTYANVEQSAINFATFTLRPWVTRIEQALSALMPRPRYVRFNVDAMIRTDMKSRYEVYQIARNIGAKNVDEIRELEDETPLPDGKGQDYTPLARNVSSGEQKR